MPSWLASLKKSKREEERIDNVPGPVKYGRYSLKKVPKDAVEKNERLALSKQKSDPGFGEVKLKKTPQSVKIEPKEAGGHALLLPVVFSPEPGSLTKSTRRGELKQAPLMVMISPKVRKLSKKSSLENKMEKPFLSPKEKKEKMASPRERTKRQSFKDKIMSPKPKASKKDPAEDDRKTLINVINVGTETFSMRIKSGSVPAPSPPAKPFDCTYRTKSRSGSSSSVEEGFSHRSSVDEGFSQGSSDPFFDSKNGSEGDVASMVEDVLRRSVDKELGQLCEEVCEEVFEDAKETQHDDEEHDDASGSFTTFDCQSSADDNILGVGKGPLSPKKSVRFHGIGAQGLFSDPDSGSDVSAEGVSLLDRTMSQIDSQIKAMGEGKVEHDLHSAILQAIHGGLIESDIYQRQHAPIFEQSEREEQEEIDENEKDSVQEKEELAREEKEELAQAIVQLAAKKYEDLVADLERSRDVEDFLKRQAKTPTTFISQDELRALEEAILPEREEMVWPDKMERIVEPGLDDLEEEVMQDLENLTSKVLDSDRAVVSLNGEMQKSEKHDDEPIEDMSEEQMREREIEKLRALVKAKDHSIKTFLTKNEELSEDVQNMRELVNETELTLRSLNDSFQAVNQRCSLKTRQNQELEESNEQLEDRNKVTPYYATITSTTYGATSTRDSLEEPEVPEVPATPEQK